MQVSFFLSVWFISWLPLDIIPANDFLSFFKVYKSRESPMINAGHLCSFVFFLTLKVGMYFPFQQFYNYKLQLGFVKLPGLQMPNLDQPTNIQKLRRTIFLHLAST